MSDFKDLKVDRHFLAEPDFVRLLEQLIEVRKMLFGLAKYLESRSHA